MPEKKPWTAEEDQLLKKMFEEDKMQKWSKIAQALAEVYKKPGRNGKQCRQRYQTCLDTSFKPLEWTREDEKLMYRLHNEIGNKWSQIAQHMAGRTDNCVKNHFYSKVRKSIRKLNKVIAQHFKKQIKQIRPPVLYKIIQASDEHLKQVPTVSLKIAQSSLDLKNRLLELDDDDDYNEADLPLFKQLSLQIHEFSNNYKRRPKKVRKGCAQVNNLLKMPKIQKFKCQSDAEEDSSFSIPASEEDSINIGEEKSGCDFTAPKLKEIIEVSNRSYCGFRKYIDDKIMDSVGIDVLMRKNVGVLEERNMLISSILRQSYESNIQDNKQQNEKFNLGQSLERFRCSIILKQDGVDIDEENKLFKSN